jgi:hypothetical protein
MSKPHNEFIVHYVADGVNPLLSFNLYDATGAQVPLASTENLGTGANGQNFFKAVLASNAEPLFVTPVLTDPSQARTGIPLP